MKYVYDSDGYKELVPPMYTTKEQVEQQRDQLNKGAEGTRSAGRYVVDGAMVV